MKRVDLEPAYVLHRRSYRETSFLLELFTLNHGRLAVIARGSRREKAMGQGILQPFVPLLVSFSGGGELMSLTRSESAAPYLPLRGDCLYAGFYLNELLVCLLQKWDPHPMLYQAYAEALRALQTPVLQEKTLRAFEKCLLEELGYGLLPKPSAKPSTFLEDKQYRFVRELGFIQSDHEERGGTRSNLFSGKSLMAIAREDWNDEECLREAKRLMRLVLTPLLGRRPIYSRQLFQQLSVAEEN